MLLTKRNATLGTTACLFRSFLSSKLSIDLGEILVAGSRFANFRGLAIRIDKVEHGVGHIYLKHGLVSQYLCGSAGGQTKYLQRDRYTDINRVIRTTCRTELRLWITRQHMKGH